MIVELFKTTQKVTHQTGKSSWKLKNVLLDEKFPETFLEVICNDRGLGSSVRKTLRKTDISKLLVFWRIFTYTLNGQSPFQWYYTDPVDT